MNQKQAKADTADVRRELVSYLTKQAKNADTGEFFFKAKFITEDLSVETSPSQLGNLIPAIGKDNSNSLNIEAWGATQATTWMATIEQNKVPADD